MKKLNLTKPLIGTTGQTATIDGGNDITKAITIRHVLIEALNNSVYNLPTEVTPEMVYQRGEIISTLQTSEQIDVPEALETIFVNALFYARIPPTSTYQILSSIV